MIAVTFLVVVESTIMMTVTYLVLVVSMILIVVTFPRSSGDNYHD